MDTQLKAIINSPADSAHYVYHFRAWPLIWETLLTTGLAVTFGMAVSVLAAVFIVESRPGRSAGDRAGGQAAGGGAVGDVRADRDPRGGAVGEHNLISTKRKQSVVYVVQLTGAKLSVAR